MFLLFVLCLCMFGGLIQEAHTQGCDQNFLHVLNSDGSDCNGDSPQLWYTDASNLLIHQLQDEIRDHTEKRKQRVQALKTKEDWDAYLVGARKTVEDAILGGKLPEKTPLNPRVTGIEQGKGFTVKKLVFESLPKYWVSAGLFLPDPLPQNTTLPAVLFASGHTEPCWRTLSTEYYGHYDGLTYQQVCSGLAKKGYVVLGWDTVGQGERKQYWDAKLNRSVVGGPTSEHTYLTLQSWLTGRPSGWLWVWDQIRSYDYLATLPYVDIQRVGMCGQSGGGMQTAYSGALDPRLKAIVPSSYITSLSQLINQIGPQDGEQIWWHGAKNNMDFGDLIEITAPKPWLELATSRDFFSVAGVQITMPEVSRLYEVLKASDRLSTSIDNYVHGYTHKNRIALYKWFSKYLNHTSSYDDPYDFLPYDKLIVTKTGQVTTDPTLNSLIAHDFIKQVAQQQLSTLAELEMNLPSYYADLRPKVASVSGFVPPDYSKTVSEAEYFGTMPRLAGYNISKYLLQGDGLQYNRDRCAVPLLMYRPYHVMSNSSQPVVLYLNPEGKTTDGETGGLFEKLIAKGHIVVAADVCGLGEVGENVKPTPPKNSYYGASERNLGAAAFMGVFLGKTIPAVMAADIIRILQFVRSFSFVKKDAITVMAWDGLAPAVIHAAAFGDMHNIQNGQMNQVALIRPSISYGLVATQKFYRMRTWEMGFAALTVPYDLPGLVGLLAPRRLMLISPQNNLLEAVNAAACKTYYNVTERAYNAHSSQFTSHCGNFTKTAIGDYLLSWMQ